MPRVSDRSAEEGGALDLAAGVGGGGVRRAAGLAMAFLGSCRIVGSAGPGYVEDGRCGGRGDPAPPRMEA